SAPLRPRHTARARIGRRLSPTPDVRARGGGLEPPITGPEPVVLPITPPPKGDEDPTGSPRSGPTRARPHTWPGRQPAVAAPGAGRSGQRREASEPDDPPGGHGEGLTGQVTGRGRGVGGRHVGPEADLVGDALDPGGVVRV